MGESCTSCDKSVSIRGKNVLIDGVINTEENITLLTKNSNEEGFRKAFTSTKEETFGCATKGVLSAPIVQESLEEFYNFVNDGKIPAFITENSSSIPSGYKYVGINLFGNAAAVPIPIDKIDTSMYLIDAGAEACKCNDTKPKGCVKKSLLGAVYCDAGSCVSCSLID